MSALNKLARASWGERLAIVMAGVLLLAVRLALAILPFRTVLGLLERAARPGHPPPGLGNSDRMLWAVEVMGHRLFPSNPCLTQALLVQTLLRRGGRPAELRIGVAREDRSRLEAHAWVESEGATVFGQPDGSRRYVPLPSFRARV